MEFFQSQIFIRAVGIIGFVLGVAAFQSNKHKTIVVTKMGSEAAFTVQYFLLGAPTGSIMNLIGVIRNLIFYRLVEKDKSTVVARWIFCGIYVLSAIITWEGPTSLLPLVGKLCSTVAYSIDNPRYIRIINIPTLIMWVVYNIACGAWEALLTDSISLISVLIAMGRFDIVPYFKKKTKQRKQ
ncbi:MAG: YgjV family protein [Clostridia bacterium]|nr:YgjV family protein [Clostridia bacterium]